MSGNKYKKHVTFFGRNQETKIEELRLLDIARDLTVLNTGQNLSIEDFIRGAALQVAAQLVVREKQRELAEARKLEAQASPTSDSAEPAEVQGRSESSGLETKQGDANGVVGEIKEEHNDQAGSAEAGAAADGAAGV